MKTLQPLVLALSLIVISQSHAQVPPPDVVQTDQFGNTAMGTGVLQKITYGLATDNTGAGYWALWSNSTGRSNSAFGWSALTYNTSGDGNSAFGMYALLSNSTGESNTAVGNAALSSNASGSNNTAVGSDALGFSGGSNNTAVGYEALAFTTSGYYNTATGAQALRGTQTGRDNTANGYQSLYSNTTGEANSAFGYQSLLSMTTGIDNAAFGGFALYANLNGNYNTAVGYSALLHSSTGARNVALGRDALIAATNGSNNVAVGDSAGANIASGSNNIDIGNTGFAADEGIVRIGAPSTQTAAYIAGISTTRLTGAAVYVSSSGQLGVLASSERYKTAINPIDDTGKLDRLRPVSFHLKNEPKGVVQYGLIAEEVDKVYPELVIRDEKGQIQGVRYDELTPILLKELQAQRKVVQLQAAELATLKRQNDAMLAKFQMMESGATRMASVGSSGR